MKRRLCLCLGLISGPGLIAALSIGASPAIAQSVITTGTGLPTSTKNAPDATVYQSAIRTFVQQKVADVIGEDPDAQRAGRNSLISECTPTSSASYFDVYGQEVNTAVVAALGKKLPLRARLNLAVIVEAVARIGKTNQVKPAVILLLNDPSSPVALWGAKAAAPVIIVMIQNPPLPVGDKLLPTLGMSVGSHSKVGFVAEAAYQALNPTIPGFAAKQVDPLVPPLITPMLDVLKIRVSMYKTAIPDLPAADGPAVSFLYRHREAATAVEQQRLIQLMSDLIASIGQQAASASRTEREQMIQVARVTAQALTVIAADDTSASADAKTAADQALKTLVSMGPGTTGSSIAERTKTIFVPLKAIKTFLMPPPVVTPAPPATAPSATVAG